METCQLSVCLDVLVRKNTVMCSRDDEVKAMNELWGMFHLIEGNRLVSLLSEKVEASFTAKLPHGFPFCCIWLLLLIKPGEDLLQLQKKKLLTLGGTHIMNVFWRLLGWVCLILKVYKDASKNINHMRVLLCQGAAPTPTFSASSCSVFFLASACKERSKLFFFSLWNYCWNEACVLVFFALGAEQKGSTFCAVSWYIVNGWYAAGEICNTKVCCKAFFW